MRADASLPACTARTTTHNLVAAGPCLEQLGAQARSRLQPDGSHGPAWRCRAVLLRSGITHVVLDEAVDQLDAQSADKTDYVSVNNDTPTPVPAPGMPFSLVFRAEPGKEDVILKVASAYQAASKRRVAPPQLPRLTPTTQTARR